MDIVLDHQEFSREFTASTSGSSSAPPRNAGFSYNTVGRRRNKGSYSTPSSSAFDHKLTETANEMWDIREPSTAVKGAAGGVNLEKPKRRRRWASFKKLVSGSAGSESRERLKEQKKASIRIQRSYDDDFYDSSFGTVASNSQHSSSTRKYSSSTHNSGRDSSFSTMSRTSRTPSTGESGRYDDADLYLTSLTKGLTLEERVMSELKPNESGEMNEQNDSEQHPPLSRRKSLKKMLKSFKFSGTSSLQKRRRDKEERSESCANQIKS